MLTPHPLPVLWSWKSRAIPLLPLWAVRPVQSLSACTRVNTYIGINKSQHNCFFCIYLCSDDMFRPFVFRPSSGHKLYVVGGSYKMFFLSVPWHNIWTVEVQLHSFLISALDEGEGSTSHPGRFISGKERRYLLNKRLGCPQSWIVITFREQKNLLHIPRIEHHIVQPVA